MGRDVRRDLRGLGFELEASVDMAEHNGAGDEHHRRGHSAEDQSKKSKTRAVGSHDTPLKIRS